MEKIKITFIGFGEASIAIIKGLKLENNKKIILFFSTFDINQKIIKKYKNNQINHCSNIKNAINNSNIIFSLVTADQSNVVAINVAKYIKKNQLYLDCNSCSPTTKIKNSKIIDNAGGKYVDVAIMAPIYPKMHKTPLLICGKSSKIAQLFFNKLNMNSTQLKENIGAASSIKMIRSIMIKGIEALTAECLLTARKLGIDHIIIKSLEKSFPNFNWYKRSGYMLERMIEHGIRRADEMNEVKLTIKKLKMNYSMTKASVDWQRLIGKLKIKSKSKNFEQLADQILNKINT